MSNQKKTILPQLISAYRKIKPLSISIALRKCQRAIFVFIVAIICFNGTLSSAQMQLRPGFDKAEYKQMMYISARTGALDSSYYQHLPKPENYQMIYRSSTMGLDNLWDLWVNESTQTAVISLRGTTGKQESWLANFYAAMAPAKGRLQVTNAKAFEYKLAEHPEAAVHVGWLLSLSYLSEDILPKIDSLYQRGFKSVLIMGHSQGGAIAYLLMAHIHYLQQDGKLSKDITFKTYCSAGPKPGNLHFAHDYASYTQMGWAYNVVNASDWVPETPISIQTLNDFSTTNPFKGAKGSIRKLKFPTNVVLKTVFNRLDKPTRKAQRNYERYLGKMTSKMVHAYLPEYKPPVYFKSNDYVRTGNIIVLYGKEDYSAKYPDDDKQVFQHHFHHPYLYLVDQLP